MVSIWTLVRFLHVMGAVLWVGGQAILTFVVRPASQSTVDEDARQRMWAVIGSSFGRVGTVVLAPLLLTTGIALAYHRGVTLAGLASPGYQGTLSFKIVLAFASFGLAALHGINTARARSTRGLSLLGIGVSVVVVLLAVSLVP